MALGRLGNVVGPETAEARRLVDEAQSLTDECVQEVRTLSHLLHPPLLEELGLEVALDTYITGFSRLSGVEVQLDVSASLARLSPEVELAAFRVVQESLGNMCRHSGARTAWVHLTCVRNRLVVEVRDSGHGIPAERLQQVCEQPGVHGLGIAGMRERLKQLGGELEIESGSSGTTVRAVVPIADCRLPIADCGRGTQRGRLKR
jgi:signal transduction histidine kinase